jgi:hypothetical protein
MPQILLGVAITKVNRVDRVSSSMASHPSLLAMTINQLHPIKTADWRESPLNSTVSQSVYLELVVS